MSLNVLFYLYVDSSGSAEFIRLNAISRCRGSNFPLMLRKLTQAKDSKMTPAGINPVYELNHV